jgi:hypothetical protein
LNKPCAITSANRLSFSSDRAHVSLPYANSELARINNQSVVNYLARFEHDSIAMRVRATIIERLPDGTPSQGNIAEYITRQHAQPAAQAER